MKVSPPVSVSVPLPVLTRAVGPPLSAITLPMVKFSTVLTVSSPLEEPMSVPPMMLPVVLPISPPESSVSVALLLSVTPAEPTRFSELIASVEIELCVPLGSAFTVPLDAIAPRLPLV